MTAIEWTDVTWNPVVGCSRVSKGCEHCYAERVAHRGMSEQHRGLTALGKHGPRWTGEVRFLADRLAEPLRWRKPRRVFVNSMSDLFHESVTDEQVAAVFGVMAATPRHTFQVLTKRPERMQAWFADHGPDDVIEATGYAIERGQIPPPDGWTHQMQSHYHASTDVYLGSEWWWEHASTDVYLGSEWWWEHDGTPLTWPLPNVWLGVSVEDQQTADERIPLLLDVALGYPRTHADDEPGVQRAIGAPPPYTDTPAALRWVSYEPALGPVDFTHLDADAAGHPSMCQVDALTGRHRDMGRPCAPVARLDWIVIGGESGPGARPFNLAWARSTIAQCREAGVPCFVKQLGARPHGEWAPGCGRLRPLGLRDRKGGDPNEWPEDLRVREWPEARRVG